MQLTVVLGTSVEVSLDIILNDTPFVKKWVNELTWCLDNCDFNQQEIFYNFLSNQEIERNLLNSCVIINKYIKNFIDIKTPFIEQAQDYFNYLHLKFERLTGEFDKPTRLFAIANQELKSAIRNLNFFVHALESQLWQNYFYISFNKDQYRRHKLAETDYNEFVFDIKPGTLYLHYAELGKTFFDLYKDNLPIDYSGLKNLHYYSGEASLSFSKFSFLSDAKYTNWLKTHNIDPYDKQLGHGLICLGHLKDINDAYQKIKTNRHLKKIEIKE